MTFLAKGKKEDLVQLASEMNLNANLNMKVLELRDLIITSEKYEEEFIKNLFNTIVEERKNREAENKEKLRLEQEESARKEKQELERIKLEQEETARKENYELEKLRLEAEIKSMENKTKITETEKNHKIEIKNLIHKYEIKEDISLYLTFFERQARRAEIKEDDWITYLLGLLPYEITQMIAREPEENVKTYLQIKNLLLKRFKLTPEKFRQLFAKHQKSPEKTWIDFYHELNNYFNGWISGLNISTFDQLKDLVVADQIKKRAPADFKEFYLDEWTNIISPIQLAEKIEEFEDVKSSLKSKSSIPNSKNKFDKGVDKVQEQFKGHAGKSEPIKSEEFKSKNSENYNKDFDRRKTLKCFVCGSSEHLRPQCPKLNKTKSEFINCVTEQNAGDFLVPFTFKGRINGISCQVLRDTGATIDIVARKYVTPTAMTGEHVWLQQPLDLTPIYLPIAEVFLECELGNIVTKAAVVPDVLDRGSYLLGNRSAAKLTGVVSSTFESTVNCFAENSPKPAFVQSSTKLNPYAKPFVPKSFFSPEKVNVTNNSSICNDLKVNAKIDDQSNAVISEEICKQITPKDKLSTTEPNTLNLSQSSLGTRLYTKVCLYTVYILLYILKFCISGILPSVIPSNASVSDSEFGETSSAADVKTNHPELHCYFDGKTFSVRTEHNPPVWLYSDADSTKRLRLGGFGNTFLQF